ncbi:uncharacterized protein [Populus alba]|uniref:uncharacterized protein n=1 Tax=Populus alba TaxID=43335 RepID=UPI003CC757AA
MNPAKRSLSSLFLFLAFPLCSSIDIIAPNQSIKDGDVLVSGGQRFALGFFSRGNSTGRYMGIWYHKVSEQTVVWVANRDNPVSGTSGVLAIDNQASGYRKFGPCRPGSPKMTQEPEPFSLALNQVGSPKYEKLGPLAKGGIQAALIVSVGVALFLIVFLVYWFVRKTKKASGRNKSFPSSSKCLRDSPINEFDEGRTGSGLPFFDLNAIAAATNNFSDANKLGEGGFGSVYKMNQKVHR